MLPTATHEIPSRRLTGVRSVTCARYAADSSNAAVNTLLPSAHGTRSTFTPHREHDTRHGVYCSHTGIRPHGSPGRASAAGAGELRGAPRTRRTASAGRRPRRSAWWWTHGLPPQSGP